MPGVKQVIDTQSDWQQGILTDVVATAAGDLELWRPDVYGPFDADFNLVRKDGTTVAPLSGHVATLRPGEGRFGGAVRVDHELRYEVGVKGAHTVVVYRAEKIWDDVGSLTWEQLSEM